jgi:putative oxidoreductase
MNNLNAWSPKVLSLLRFVTGLMFLEHGLQKIFHFPPALPAPGAAAAAAGAPHGLPPMIMAAGWIEIVCGVLIALGLFGRAAAFIASGEMAVAYFIGHASRNPFPVNTQGDAAILYCFFFLYIVFAGPGPLSIDGMLKKKI